MGEAPGMPDHFQLPPRELARLVFFQQIREDSRHPLGMGRAKLLHCIEP